MNTVDYNVAWTQWDDMIRYSPAPFHRRRLILKLAAGFAFDSVLDIGCGNGALLDTIGRGTGLTRLAGVDISGDVIAANRKALPAMEFHTLDIGRESLPSQFSLIICSEVLEHVQDYQAALRNIGKMCSGHLILTVPRGRIFEIDRQMGHFRHFDAADIESALVQSGFKPLTVWRWGFPFHCLYKRLINVRPTAATQAFAGGSYTPSAKAIGRLITWLFYLSLRDCRLSNQLVVSAEVA